MDKGEKLILKRIRQGDQQTFELVFNKYHPKLFKLAVHILKEKETAAEIVNDVFVSLWENRKEVEIKKNLEAFLVVKVKSYAINALRKKIKGLSNTSESHFGLLQLEIYYYQDEDITQKIFSENLYRQFMDIIGRLPEQQQKIIKMSRLEGLTANEIAEKTNLSKRTIETHIHQALKFIKTGLAGFTE
jgi:RNA polymerase sigma-70 factor, ECF subfamily